MVMEAISIMFLTHFCLATFDYNFKELLGSFTSIFLKVLVFAFEAGFEPLVCISIGT